MDNSDSGDELSQGFLNDEQQYMLTAVGEMIDPEEHTDDSSHDIFKNNLPLREQDRFLPIANIAKIMKRAIPENGKIAKDARECIQECVSEFISFVTSEASDRCHMEKRKTINGEDILYAMTNLGFDNYVEPLKLYLQKYRELAAITSTKAEKSLGDNIIFEEEGYQGNHFKNSHIVSQDGQQNETVIFATYSPGDYQLS